VLNIRFQGQIGSWRGSLTVYCRHGLLGHQALHGTSLRSQAKEQYGGSTGLGAQHQVQRGAWRPCCTASLLTSPLATLDICWLRGTGRQSVAAPASPSCQNAHHCDRRSGQHWFVQWAAPVDAEGVPRKQECSRVGDSRLELSWNTEW
jgi:hypothetical protein